MHNFTIRLFFMVFFSFAALNASGGGQTIDSLYEKRLKPSYDEIKPYREAAKNRKTVYIASAVVWLLIFGLLAKYFSITGVIVSLIIGGLGYYYLNNLNTSPVSDFEDIYKSKIISPIGENSVGFVYKKDSISKDELLKTKIFATKIKSYKSQDRYVKDGVSFGWVDITFDTGNNEAEERMEQNVFKGYIITVDKASTSQGVAVSQQLLNKVAKEDIKMSSFFSDLKPRTHKGKFDIYGHISADDLAKILKFSDNKIAVSFTKNKIYIAQYSQTYPLEVKIYTDFDFDSALKYEKTFNYIDKIADAFK